MEEITLPQCPYCALVHGVVFCMDYEETVDGVDCFFCAYCGWDNPDLQSVLDLGLEVSRC